MSKKAKNSTKNTTNQKRKLKPNEKTYHKRGKKPIDTTINDPIDVLIVCESSGVVREAFRKRGFNAWSCDILPADDNSNYHIKGDMFDAIEKHIANIKLLICHPPCTYLCSSGLHWNKRTPGRQEKTDAALNDVRRLLAYDIPHIALENPSRMHRHKNKKSQSIYSTISVWSQRK